MIYLDQAATTFPKPASVIKEYNRCIKEYCGNPGRSQHRLSFMASEAIYSARENVADFFNFPSPENVVFTMNATYALNIAIKGLLHNGDHVIISDIEHNSVLRPVTALMQERNISFSVFKVGENLYESIPTLIRKNTKMIIASHVSNVFGDITDIKAISDIAGKHGLLFMLDASQSAGHIPIDLLKTPVDVLCAPGHKGLLGIQGCGFAIFKSKDALSTIIEGGSGSDSMNPSMPDLLPERLEAGTLPTPAIVSLSAGIDFLRSAGIENVQKKIEKLSERINASLRDNSKIILYNNNNSGVISFNIKNMDPSFVASELDGMGICVRSGLHCSPLAHKKYGTSEKGTVRVSVGFLNEEKDADMLEKALYKLTR